MKRYLSLIMVALMLSIFGLSYALTIQVGDGDATTSHFPFYGFYSYGYSQQIYTQAQVNTVGNICKIRFYYVSGSIPNNKDWTIWMGHTQKTEFTSNSDWEDPTALTQVFNGDVTALMPAANNWLEITLTTPFAYNNTDNLLIAVHQYTAGYSSMSWGGFTSGSNTGLSFYSDSSNPDPAAPPTSGSYFYRSGTINRIQLVFPDIEAPLAPVLVSPASGDYLLAGDKLTWAPTAGAGDVTDYDVYLGTDANPPLTANNVTLTSYQPTDLLPGTTYYWKVVAKNAIGSSPASEVWSFVTPGANQLVESFEDSTFPPLGWNAGGWSPSTFQYVHGAKSAYKNGTTSEQFVLSTPMLSIENDSRINFWARCTNTTAYLQVVYSTDRLTWTQIGSDFSFAEPNEVNTWYNVDVDLSSLSGANYYIGFRTGLTSGSYYVDMVIGPDCAALVPDAPTLTSPADAATFVSVTPTFTWTAANTGGLPTSYNIYCDANANPTTLIGTSTTASFTPTTALPYGSTLYWTVKSVNATGESAAAAPQSFTTEPEGLVFIGDGSANNNLPIHPYYNYNYSQTIYLQSDIDVADQRIEDIAFYWNGAAAGTNSRGWTVYMAHTDKTAFSGDQDWVPYAQLAQVFTGDLNIPTTPGWVNIHLQNPFIYNNTDNLLIAVYENTPGNSGNSGFFHSTAVEGTRALLYRNDSTNPNPATPPTASFQRSAYANIRIIFGDLPVVPVLSYTPDTIDFGIGFANTPTEYQNVTVTNTGAGTLNLFASDVSIIGPDAAMFEINPGFLSLALTTGQSGNVPVRYNPAAVGTHTATLRMVYGGNNYDVALSGRALSENALYESFEGSTFPPVGWDAGGWTSSTTAYHGSRSAYKYGSNYVLSTPMLSIDTDSRLNFWARSTSSSGILQIVYSTDRSDWVQLGSNINFAASSTWYNQDIDLSSLAGNNYYLGVRTGSSATYYVDMFIGPDFAAIVPDAPVLVSPADLATDVSITPTFTWTAASTGGVPTSYNVYCDANTNPTTLIGNSTTTSFTPTTALPYGSTLYWTVKAVNATGESAAAAPQSFTTVPEGLVTIGDGTANNNLPIYPYYNYSYSQTIYLQSDINVADQRIENISFHWNGTGVGTNSRDWIVYMAHTDKTAFSGSADWVPFDQLTEVFNGELDLPATPGWVNITLQNPFIYNNTDNLLICVDENTAGNSGYSPYFYSTTVTGTRALLYYSDGTNPNPASPPDANGQKNAYANIRLQFGDVPTVPVFTYAPAAIDFGAVGYNVASAAVNVTVTNTGSGTLTLNASDISIIGPNAAEFSFGTGVLPANLGIGQAVNIPVTVQSTTEGLITATLRMTYDGVDYDVALSADVSPQGYLIIGNGTAVNSYTGYPAVYGGWNKNGREQYIITAAELTAAGAQAGWINSISFNVQNPNNCADLPQFTISMGHTDVTEFANTTFLTDLTQVYQAATYTPTAGLNTHAFPVNFVWDGTSNIVIQTSFNMLPSYVTHAQTYQTDTTVNRTLYYASDSTAWDTVTTGNLSTKRPNMVLRNVVPLAGPPAAPILSYPADGATGMPIAGFDLAWEADYINGGVPTYYTVLLGTDADPVNNNEYSWETTNTSFNPVVDDTDYGFSFTYDQRYYWTVSAHNDDGDEVQMTPRTFVIEDDPSIVALPYEENFDAVTTPNFPRAWTAYQSNSSSVLTTSSSYSQTPENSVCMSTRSTGETLQLITPPIAVPINGIRLSFWLRAGGTTNYSMKVGTVNATDGTGEFTQVAEINPTASSTWELYEVSFAAYTGTDQYICFQHGAASSNQTFYLDSVRLEQIPAIDLKAASMVAPGSGNVGRQATFKLNVQNHGLDSVANYTVYLKDSEDNTLGSTAVNETLAPNATAEISVTWTPTTAGTYSVYMEVVATGDGDASNNATAAQPVTVYSASTEFLSIGATEDLTAVTYAPFTSYWKAFVAETVYLASEIQASAGTIQSLVYYNNFTYDWTFPAQIYMKNTDVADMNAWPTFDGYTLVFSGDIVCPAGVNEIVIPLTTPFSYTGGNLSIRTTKTYQSSWKSGNNWYTTVDYNYPNRTRYQQSDTESNIVYDNPTGGSTVNNVPNITFVMDPATLVTTVAAPVVTVTMLGSNAALTWEAIPYAYSYKVYESADPYSFGDEPTAIVYTNGATRTVTDRGFFKVVANTYRSYGRGESQSMWESVLDADFTVDNPIEKAKEEVLKGAFKQ